MYEIIIGRTEAEKRRLGLEGTIFLGKHYVKMGNTATFSNKVYMDISKSHVVLISGKRGSGKSYSLGVIAEEMANLPEHIKDKIAVLLIDTMGIFWTMKYPNIKDEELLEEWNLTPKPLNIHLYAPKSYAQKEREQGIPIDYSFTIKPSELTTTDWCTTLNIEEMSPLAIAIDRAKEKLEHKDFSIEEMIETIQEDKKIEEQIKLAAENKLRTVNNWGIFSEEATPIKEIIKGGQTTVLDISQYKDWNVKNLVIGLIARKLFTERMAERKKEEIRDIQGGHSYFQTRTESGTEMPIAWIFLDECHESIPKEEKTPATDALVTILREGRQPGISLVLATQQPGEIHKDVITQSDLVISHRLTARKDITALNDMMQSYLFNDIQKYFNDLPKVKGGAIVLDDNAEKLFNIQVRPKFSWHGGEAPVAVKAKGRAAAELGL